MELVDCNRNDDNHNSELSTGARHDEIQNMPVILNLSGVSKQRVQSRVGFSFFGHLGEVVEAQL